MKRSVAKPLPLVPHADYTFGPLSRHHWRIRMPSGIERVREIRRLRTRKKKVAKLLARARAGTMDKPEVARKLRRMTTGAEVIIEREGLK